MKIPGIVWVKNRTNEPEKKSRVACQRPRNGATNTLRKMLTALFQAAVKLPRKKSRVACQAASSGPMKTARKMAMTLFQAPRKCLALFR